MAKIAERETDDMVLEAFVSEKMVSETIETILEPASFLVLGTIQDCLLYVKRREKLYGKKNIVMTTRNHWKRN